MEPQYLEIKENLNITTASQRDIAMKKTTLNLNELSKAKKKISDKSDKFVLMELAQKSTAQMVLLTPMKLYQRAENFGLKFCVKDWPSYLISAGYFVPPEYCFTKDYLHQLWSGSKLLVIKFSKA